MYVHFHIQIGKEFTVQGYSVNKGVSLEVQEEVRTLV